MFPSRELFVKDIEVAGGNMDPVFTQVTEESQVRAVAVLALEIWRQHYTPILGTAQVEYMLTRFQSVDAIDRNTSAISGCRYLTGGCF